MGPNFMMGKSVSWGQKIGQALLWPMAGFTGGKILKLKDGEVKVNKIPGLFSILGSGPGNHLTGLVLLLSLPFFLVTLPFALAGCSVNVITLAVHKDLKAYHKLADWASKQKKNAEKLDQIKQFLSVYPDHLRRKELEIQLKSRAIEALKKENTDDPVLRTMIDEQIKQKEWKKSYLEEQMRAFQSRKVQNDDEAKKLIEQGKKARDLFLRIHPPKR